MKNFIDSIEFKRGSVTHNDFFLVENVSLEEQESVLKEDMLQAEFPGGEILDVGWFPSFDYHNGRFQVRIIKDYDWEHPIYFRETNELESLRQILNEAIETASTNKSG